MDSCIAPKRLKPAIAVRIRLAALSSHSSNGFSAAARPVDPVIRRTCMLPAGWYVHWTIQTSRAYGLFTRASAFGMINNKMLLYSALCLKIREGPRPHHQLPSVAMCL